MTGCPPPDPSAAAAGTHAPVSAEPRNLRRPRRRTDRGLVVRRQDLLPQARTEAGRAAPAATGDRAGPRRRGCRPDDAREELARDQPAGREGSREAEGGPEAGRAAEGHAAGA